MSSDLTQSSNRFPIELAVYTLTSEQMDDVCGIGIDPTDTITSNVNHEIVKRQSNNFDDNDKMMVPFLMDFLEQLHITSLVFLANKSDRKSRMMFVVMEAFLL